MMFWCFAAEMEQNIHLCSLLALPWEDEAALVQNDLLYI